MHCVKVVDKCLHSLICWTVNFLFSVFLCKLLDFTGKLFTEFFCKQRKLCLGILFACHKGRLVSAFFCCLCHNFFGYIYCFVNILNISQKLNCSCKILTVKLEICFLNAGSHTVVKVRNRLTAVLVVLVTLYSNTGKCRIWGNVVWFSKVTVTCGESAFKQTYKVNLTTGGCESKEVKVMNVNISVFVCLGMLWVEDIHFIELLCTLTAVFKHCTHCCVAVDICIFSLYIVILSWFKS